MKLKRILALMGVVILAGLYLCTLIFSMMGGELAMGLFRASVFCTVAVPIMLYVYMMVYKVLRGRGVPKEPGKPEGPDAPAKKETGHSSSNQKATEKSSQK